jgi:hypothetical protein
LGGRFPALAVFGLPALSVALALVVLWGLRPWEDSADAPHEVPLGIEMAVGDGKALPGTSTAVAAGVAVPAGPKVQAARPAAGVAGPTPSPAPSSDGAQATAVVAPARAIAVAEVPSSPSPEAPESGGREELPSGGETTGEARPEETSSPVATPAGPSEGSPGGPVSAGVEPPVLESCEGDEYVIAVTFLDEGSTVEEAPVEIVLERLNEDGTADELQLEGNLSDVRALAATLEAEGNCVKVVIEGPVGEEGAEETPESGEEVVEPGESPVPVSP